MNSRERVLLTINHKEPDRVPFDMGATVVTGIQAKAYQRLREYLNFPEKEIKIIDILQQLAQVDDDIMDTLDVDMRNVSPRSTATFQIDINETEDGRYLYFYDEYQIGWRMPKVGGMYYDMFDHPLAGDITAGDVDRSQLPDPVDPSRFAGIRVASEKILHEDQRSEAPKACKVSINTAVCMVICRQPAMRAPRRGCCCWYRWRSAISPGISVSAMAISLRPKSATLAPLETRRFSN